MKKRYHKSKRSEGRSMMYESPERYMHEKDMHNDEKHSGGHERAMHGNYSAHYAGPEMRRHQEMMKGGMIKEDHSQIANLPQGVMMKPYPMVGPYMPEGIDDTIYGADMQMGMDDSKRAKHFYPHKY